uniref:Epidermal patterning factor-like protein n=1 Tax=Steinernema glaseri TaxID=37863 RepID=A0A1I7ZTG0_9BILA
MWTHLGLILVLLHVATVSSWLPPPPPSTPPPVETTKELITTKAPHPTTVAQKLQTEAPLPPLCRCECRCCGCKSRGSDEDDKHGRHGDKTMPYGMPCATMLTVGQINVNSDSRNTGGAISRPVSISVYTVEYKQSI